ncbi:glycosyltransferase [bacterium]|nr:glycosyltransferase [bacterium]
MNQCLVSLQQFRLDNDKILLVNAASSDGTSACARQYKIDVLEVDQPSRSNAVNAGVNHLLNDGYDVDVIIIAHADMVFHEDARSVLLRCLNENPDRDWGAFGHRIDDPHWSYRLVERGNALRARQFGLAYGDQAQFFRTEGLKKIGGFPQTAAYEDLELSLRFRELHKPLYLNCPVMIPNRHWRRGVVRTTFTNWMTLFSYLRKRSK